MGARGERRDVKAKGTRDVAGSRGERRFYRVKE